MPPLDALQSSFAASIRRSVAVADQPGGPTLAGDIAAGNARLSPTAQLEVYREQFWLRHVGALEEDFVTLVHLLGHDRFHALAERYLEAHPPTAFSLRDLGADMGSFVASHPDYSGDPLLVDCARLEWAFVEAFDAADAPPLDAAALTSIPEDAWSGARLTLHPSVQRVALAHPTHDYRAAVRAGSDPPRPDAVPTHVVVYRGPETLQYIDIEPLAFELLDHLARGETLGDACEAVAVGEGLEAELEEKVGGWFQFWAAYGWISAITT
jgi:hypothetical protein